VSESNRREHVDVLGRRAGKFVVVPNGIDLERFATEDGAGVHAELGLPPAAPLVGVVARLAEERKGIALFLQMAAAVAQVDADVHFVIIGDGPLRPGLEQRAAELGVAERVSFLGARADVPRLVAALQLFVLPSLYEAGPLTLLEAMALGKAVVTTPVGVAEDVVCDEGTGLIVPVGDADALAAAVLRLLSNDELRASMGKRAREEAWPAFSVDHMVDETIRVYQSML
jgi:glycosyltransferase involved in cell wall biosynthesis